MCCVEERFAFADLVKIGKEKHPWNCSENNVYIALQPAAVQPRTGIFHVDDSDVLTKITIFHQLEGRM